LEGKMEGRKGLEIMTNDLTLPPEVD